MPYIKREDRDVINDLIDEVADYVSIHPGRVNYTITRLLHNVILNKTLSYTVLNGLIGVLECAKLELYRQIVAPYEDQKKAINGPVSDLDI